MQEIIKIRIGIKLKNLSRRLQFKMEKSNMQQHELKKNVKFTVYGKPNKMNKKLRNLQRNRPEIFLKEGYPNGY